MINTKEETALLTTSVKYEANRCGNYHSRKFNIELTVPDGYSILSAMTLAQALVDYKLDGSWNLRRRELIELATKSGQHQLIDEIEETF